MTRARNKTVVSQRDIRQTSNFTHGNPHPKTFCACCRVCGIQYECLRECAVLPAPTPDNEPPPGWTNFTYQGESWSPVSGPCCDECLEATFNRKRSPWRQEQDDDVPEVQSWWHERSVGVRVFVAYSWTLFCGWLNGVKQNWSSNSEKVERWHDVDFEAEGFLEVRIVLSRQGAIQHMEIDFPTDVTISVLKQELATLIDVPPDAQLWFYRAEQMDETKTLDELNVDIGAMIEVRCTN